MMLAMPDELVGGGDRLAISVDKTLRRFEIHRPHGNLKSEDHGAVLNWLIERNADVRPTS